MNEENEKKQKIAELISAIKKAKGIDSENISISENEIIDSGIESLQENGGMSEAAMEADYEAEQNPRPDYLDENGNAHWFDEEENIVAENEVLDDDEIMRLSFLNDNKETFKAIDDYLEKGIRPKNNEFIFSKNPEILKYAGISENEIVIKTSIINKARNEHSLSDEEIKDSIINIASPILIFDSDKTTTENKKESFLCLTDTFAANGKPIAFSMNLDSSYERKNRLLEVNEIRSIHDRTLVAKNGTDLIQKWTENGLCRYVDDKKISEWSKAAGVQFPLAVLQSDKNNILSESDVVNGKKISERQLAAGVQSPLAVLHSDINNVKTYSDFVNQHNIVAENEREYQKAEDFSVRMFTYNDFNFVSVRKFSEEERTFVDSVVSNEQNKKLLSKNALYYAGFLESQKPATEQKFEKALKVFNKTDFQQASKSDADIFYCREKGIFYTFLNDDFLVPLEFVYSSDRQEKELFENRFSGEIESFRNDNYDFLKGTLSYELDEEKDFALMSDIADVLSEGEVFTRKNVNIDGEIKIKLGDLFDKKNPEKIQPTGLRHLIKHRMEERLNNGLSMEDAQRETTAVLFLALNNIDKAPAVKEQNGRYAIYKNGIKTLIGKDKKGKYVVSGFDYIDTKREATDSIGTGIARYGYTPGFLEIYDQVGAVASELNIHKKNSVVNDKADEKNQQSESSFDNAVKNRFEEAAQKLTSLDINSENYKEAFELLNRIEKLTGISEPSEKIDFAENEVKENFQPSPNEKIPEEIDNAKIVDEKSEIQAAQTVSESNSKSVENGNPAEKASLEENVEIQKEYVSYQDYTDGKVIYGKTVLPPFASMTSDGHLKTCENFVVKSYDSENGTYLVENENEKLSLPRETFNSLLNPAGLYKEQQEEKTFQMEGNGIVFDNPDKGVKGTVIPEFSLMTQNGLQTYKDCVVTKFNESDKTYTLKNGDSVISVTEERFKEITSPERFENKFDENTPSYKKMLKTQYEDFFKERSNTAYNFRHNLSVFCRKEANSPCDALKVAKGIIRKMSPAEQDKTKRLLKKIAREGESLNQLIVRTYHEAIKEVPLNEEYIKQYQPENRIARPFYDTISSDGQKIDSDPQLLRTDKDYNLKIGDTLKDIDIKSDKIFGHGKENVHFSELKVISASKEGNTVTLMDKEKSFIEIPRDTVLKAYKEQQLKEMKHQQNHSRCNSMEISYR